MAFYLLGVLAYCTATYFSTKDALLQGVDERLVAGARTALFLATEQHHGSDADKAIDPEAYAELQERLNELCRDLDLSYAYTMMQKDGEVYYTSSTFADGPDAVVAYYGTSYSDASDELNNAIINEELTFENYEDSEGNFRSVFLPARSDDGDVYIAGTDLEISSIDSSLRMQILRSTGTGLLFIALIAPMFIVQIRCSDRAAVFLREEVRRKTQDVSTLNAQLEERISDAELTAEQAERARAEAEQASKKAAHARKKGMADAAEILGEVAERSIHINDDLKNKVDAVSGGAESQRERMQETAAAMEQMTRAASEIARDAGRTSDSADKVRLEAETDEVVVSEMADAINELRESAARTTEGLNELGTHAEGIGQVMTVIQDIADQTNLLALNAAIEAARAGDAGRGFAVVADEVRKLAEKTVDATKEVDRAVRQIQEETRRNVATMKHTAEAVAKSTELATDAAEALRIIRESATESAQLVGSIASASEEQSATLESVSRTTDEVSTIVGRTAGHMHDANQCMEELSQQVRHVHDVVQELKRHVI